MSEKENMKINEQETKPPTLSRKKTSETIHG